MIKFIRIKTALSLLLIIPLFSFAQFEDSLWRTDLSKIIPQDAKIIYVKNVKFIDACNAILDQGLQIEEKDNDLQTAQTKKGAEWDAILNIRVKDNVLTIRPLYWDTVFGQYRDGKFISKKKGYPWRNAVVNPFIVALRVAIELGGEISYSK